MGQTRLVARRDHLTGETYKAYVKTTFAKGASTPDPTGLSNSSLDGNVRRAIDFRKDQAFDEAAFKALVRAAVAVKLAGREEVIRIVATP